MMAIRGYSSLASRGALGALSALLLLAGCAKDEQESSGAAAGSSPKQAPSTTATRVEVAAIQVTQPTLRITRPGEVQGAREATLASALGGFVEAVKVESGDRIEKGKPVAYVDSSIHNAQAKVTKVELGIARRDLARLEKLGKSVAEMRVDAARSQVERAEAQHALSQARQSRAVIRAPFSGSIVDLQIERGEVVSPGMPLGRLIQLDPVHVTVSVADRDIASLEVGGQATVTAAGAPMPVTGRIHRIEPAADLQTRTFMVEVEVENKEQRLLPGMIARVSFDRQGPSDSLLLPQDFLVTQLDGNGVFVADKDDKARWRPLELGNIIGSQVEITSGLSPGERVVIKGHRGLSEGDQLMITRNGECCTRGRVKFDVTGGAAKAPTKAKAPTDEAHGDKTSERPATDQPSPPISKTPEGQP